MVGLYGKSACHTNAPKSGPLLPSPPVPRYLPRHSAPLVVCEVTGVKGAACSKRKGVFYVAENVSGLMLVSPSAPVGRVIKVRLLFMRDVRHRTTNIVLEGNHTLARPSVAFSLHFPFSQLIVDTLCQPLTLTFLCHLEIVDD